MSQTSYVVNFIHDDQGQMDCVVDRIWLNDGTSFSKAGEYVTRLSLARLLIAVYNCCISGVYPFSGVGPLS